jgi:tRNA(adenine34) deaminase
MYLVMAMQKEYFMQKAIDLAKISYKNGDVPIGCVIVKDDEIVGQGYNQKEEKKDASMHAEMIALKDACKNLSSYHLEDCDMYVSLEPCAMCSGAIINFRIRNVYIATENERFGCCGSKINLLDFGFNHTCKVEFGLLKDQASNLISDFFKELRK